jgi:hypothetical protein
MELTNDVTRHNLEGPHSVNAGYVTFTEPLTSGDQLKPQTHQAGALKKSRGRCCIWAHWNPNQKHTKNTL